LFESGCDGAGVGSCEGAVTVYFDREAGSLSDAVGSAVNGVSDAGDAAARVDVGLLAYRTPVR
jgi:hypothetical protein